MSEEMEACVARGVEWLDDKHPGWADRIDLDSLDMDRSCLCVLGQVIGNFWSEKSQHESGLGGYQTWARSHGFDTIPSRERSDERVNRAYRELGAVWTRVVRERRGESPEMTR